jgi:hypothetical protein
VAGAAVIEFLCVVDLCPSESIADTSIEYSVNGSNPESVTDVADLLRSIVFFCPIDPAAHIPGVYVMRYFEISASSLDKGAGHDSFNPVVPTFVTVTFGAFGALARNTATLGAGVTIHDAPLAGVADHSMRASNVSNISSVLHAHHTSIPQAVTQVTSPF